MDDLASDNFKNSIKGIPWLLLAAYGKTLEEISWKKEILGILNLLHLRNKNNFLFPVFPDANNGKLKKKKKKKKAFG